MKYTAEVARLSIKGDHALTNLLLALWFYTAATAFSRVRDSQPARICGFQYFLVPSHRQCSVAQGL